MNKKIVTALIAIIIIGITFGTYLQSKHDSQIDISLLPMYGGHNKTIEQVRADDEFVKGIIAATGSKEQAIIQALSRGEESLQRGDYNTAIRRYNQAWLLNPNEPAVYIGLGDVLTAQGNSEKAAKMYKIAYELQTLPKSEI